MNGPYDIYTDTGEGDYGYELCPTCNTEMEWVECHECGGEGGFDMAEDPFWYEPGDWVDCHLCLGKGGWWGCPNAENHESYIDPQSLYWQRETGLTARQIVLRAKRMGLRTRKIYGRFWVSAHDIEKLRKTEDKQDE